MQTNKKNKNIIGIIQSFLILILVVLVIFMMIQISRLQGTARVINYAGLGGKISIEYNAISGRLIIINGNRQILCQRDDPKFDIFKLFEVSSADIQHIRALLDQTSIQNTEISFNGFFRR